MRRNPIHIHARRFMCQAPTRTAHMVHCRTAAFESLSSAGDLLQQYIRTIEASWPGTGCRAIVRTAKRSSWTHCSVPWGCQFRTFF